jgi:cytochrome oxidase Cu insertion factor (SCO1/SenC/PrrC family)
VVDTQLKNPTVSFLKDVVQTALVSRSIGSDPHIIEFLGSITQNSSRLIKDLEIFYSTLQLFSPYVDSQTRGDIEYVKIFSIKWTKKKILTQNGALGPRDTEYTIAHSIYASAIEKNGILDISALYLRASRSSTT